MTRMKKKYLEEVAPALMEKFQYKSTMQIPKIDKVVVNVGCGEARENAKILEAVCSDLSTITGQKAIITIAKKSVANFKLREGMPVGAKVTLRGEEVHLTQIEYKIVELIARRPGRVLTYDYIISRIWGPYAVDNNRILRVNMAHIRRKLEDNPAEPYYIRTEIGVGYRMAEE